ncbi:MAG: hypothetical protein KBT33_05030 [Prevotellaceae bacterium]|nr:hypothetical protein [Candidatus Minthosoma equi]
MAVFADVFVAGESRLFGDTRLVANGKNQKPVGFEGRLQFGRNCFVEGAGKNYDDFALALKEKGEHLPFNGRMEDAHDGCIFIFGNFHCPIKTWQDCFARYGA